MNRLGDWILDSASGPFGSNLKVECFVDDGFPIIDGANLKEVEVTDNITKFVTEEKARSLGRSIAKRHDVVVTISGTLGQISYIPLDSKYPEYLCSQRQFRVTFDESKVDVEYLVYYFHTTVGQKKILSFANYVGVPALAQPLPNFRAIQVDFPDLDTQHKVVKAIKSFDNLIKTNQRINRNLEELARLIYDYWFVQFDFPGKNGKPYKTSGGKMVYNDQLKREIPAGWEVTRLGDLFKTNRGVSYSTPTLGTEGDGVPMINLASFSPNESYNEKGIKYYKGEYTDEKVLKPFDFVMCNTQQTAIDPQKDIIGRSMLVPDIFDGDIVSSHHVNTIKLEKENLKFYLNRLFNTKFYHAYISKFANGTNILGLIFSGVEDYMCEIPSDDLLEKFAKISLDIEKKKSKIIKENQKLTILRDKLLPLLMNGQVTII